MMIKEKIIEARKKQGLTQSELAERVGLSQPYLSAIESGKIEPGLKMIERILNALNIEIS